MTLGGLSEPIDRTTALCLACSSSLPPLKSLSPSTRSSFSGKSSEDNYIHITKCCQRAICPSCISSNPRLARYDPCLACLGGVSAVAPRSSLATQTPKYPHAHANRPPERNYNLDGSVRDEDTFILGDDDSDDDEGKDFSKAHRQGVDNNLDTDAPPPPYQVTSDGNGPSLTSETSSRPRTVSLPGHNGGAIAAAEPLLATTSAVPSVDRASEECEATLAPYKYYINRSDTLLGICLRFGVDSREVCNLNNLPPSVMRTTPHLLHTRSFILLPANPKTSHHAAFQSGKAEEAEEIRRREENLVRERAEKRLQTLTKEVDWRVAKAYVALADDVDEREAHNGKRKEMGTSKIMAGGSLDLGKGSTSRELEAMAIERYLDDDEWEAAERKAGRIPEARLLPVGSNSSYQDGRLRGPNRKGWW